jgi:hypothetical protein
MLFTLRHLLVTITLFTVGVVVCIALFQTIGVPSNALSVLGVFGGGVLTLVFLSWPIYQILHLRPIGLPPCLHCGKSHGNYHVPADSWPCGVLICSSCGKPTRFYMSHKRPFDERDNMPILYLHWPEFLGIWRQASSLRKPPETENE